MEGSLKRTGVRKFWKLYKINKINKIENLCIINTILHQYKTKYFKKTNFRGIDFLDLLREIFVQLLIFMYFTNCNCNCNWYIFNKRYRFCKMAFIRRGRLKEGVFYKIFKIKLGVYNTGHLKERGLLLQDLLCHTWYDFQVAYIQLRPFQSNPIRKK